MTRRTRSPRLGAGIALALLWLGTASVLAVWFSGRIRDWALMTDELQYVKLALAVAQSYSPLPSIHGASVAATNQLYPMLLSPVYGSLSSPDAFRAAHVLNAVVMTSAAVPAYLLARELVARSWSLAVALLTVAVPWMALTGFLMSEVAAYPAFLWAMLACHRTLVEPGVRRDVLASFALIGAILARTQFAALALALLAAILVHELGRARAVATAGAREQLIDGARSALRRHRVLWGVYAAGAVAAAVTALLGNGVFGAYSTTVEGGWILPAGVWWFAAEHLAAVGIGCGFVPLMLGGAWMLAAFGRPPGPGRAFATLSLATIAVLAIETASFDLRFGGPDVIRDRYLFYVVPLLLIGSAAALADRPRRSIVVGLAVVTAAFAAAAHGLRYPTFPGVSLDSPVSILNEALRDQSGTLGVGTFVALAVVAIGVALAAALLALPRGALSVVLFGGVLAFSVLTLRSEGNRVLEGTGLTGRPLAGPPGVVLDWVDSVVPDGETAALVPFPISTAWDISAIQWWDVEFWNRSIRAAYTAPDGNFTYTTFPVRTLAVDPLTGSIPGTSDAPGYLVVAPRDPRLGLAGRTHAENAGLAVVAVDRPYRAVWSSEGLTTDGWTVPGHPAVVRFYGAPDSRPEVVRAEITVRSPAGSAGDYRVEAETVDRPGTVAADSTTTEIVLVCVASRSPFAVRITSSTGVVADGPPLQPEAGPRRRVGVGLGPITVRSTGRSCGADDSS